MPAAKFTCAHCESTYTRRDSLRRHIKFHHRDKDDLKRLRALAAYTTAADCRNLWSPEVDQYVDAYFSRFHPTWSFLPKATFSPRRELPFLVQAVVMIGLWATTGTRQQGARQAAVKLHEKMRASILEQQERWDVSNLDDDDDPQLQGAAWPVGTSQAILLFLIFTTMLETRQETTTATATPTTRTDRAILVALVKSCLKRGMFSHPRMVAQCSDGTVDGRPSSHALLCAWTAVEEAKRFAAALHRVWRLYEQSGFLPEEEADLLVDEDSQFPTPDAEYLWDASDEADLLRRIGEERSRGKGPAECEMRWLGGSWDHVLREYVGDGVVREGAM